MKKIIRCSLVWDSKKGKSNARIILNNKGKYKLVLLKNGNLKIKKWKTIKFDEEYKYDFNSTAKKTIDYIIEHNLLDFDLPKKDNKHSVTRGNLVWGGICNSEKVFVPNPKGNYKKITDGDTTIIMSVWDLLEEPKKENEYKIKAMEMVFKYKKDNPLLSMYSCAIRCIYDLNIRIFNMDSQKHFSNLEKECYGIIRHLKLIK